MATVLRHIRFGAKYIYPYCRDISILRNSRWPPSAILNLLVEPWTTQEGPFVMDTPVKFRHDRLSSFIVIRIWIFCNLGLKVYSRPKISVLGFDPKIRGTSFWPPTNTSLRGTTTGISSRTCAHDKEYRMLTAEATWPRHISYCLENYAFNRCLSHESE